jgi:asparagine synthase (glutamine-hydrolysing)
MAHRPETRVPFLVNDLIELAMRCPVVLKLNNLSDGLRMNENEPGGERGKYFLKAARIYEFLDRRTAKALVNEHLAGKRNGRLRIWSLLSLEQLLVELAPT